jgi:hypothetical protein
VIPTSLRRRRIEANNFAAWLGDTSSGPTMWAWDNSTALTQNGTRFIIIVLLLGLLTFRALRRRN